jgi:hypothetical protein
MHFFTFFHDLYISLMKLVSVCLPLEQKRKIVQIRKVIQHIGKKHLNSKDNTGSCPVQKIPVKSNGFGVSAAQSL